jgi:hypothetical protein
MNYGWVCHECAPICPQSATQLIADGHKVWMVQKLECGLDAPHLFILGFSRATFTEVQLEDVNVGEIVQSGAGELGCVCEFGVHCVEHDMGAEQVIGHEKLTGCFHGASVACVDWQQSEG